MTKSVAEYATVLRRSLSCLQPFALSEATSRSTSSLFFGVEEVLVKLLNPGLLERVMDSQGRTTPHAFVLHERESMRRGYEAIHSDSNNPIPYVLHNTEVMVVLQSCGVSPHDSVVLAEWCVAYRRAAGVRIGRFDPVKRAYTYRLRVGGSCELWRDSFQRLREAIRQMNSGGVFHNDLAPQNIIADTVNHRLHVIDFGAAFLDYRTSWEQPSVDFIDEWYAKSLKLDGLRLRSFVGALRETGVSKDLADIDDHTSSLFARDDHP